MSRGLVLDLFCKAGGAARGIAAAGFTPIGVDIEPQPNYPYAFVQMDALEFLRGVMNEERHWAMWPSGAPGLVALDHFLWIWASPPCLDSTVLKHAPNGKKHECLIAPTRAWLLRTGKPYVIENVEGAREKLVNPTKLCGTMFSLSAVAGGIEWDLQRHRLFETSFPLVPPGPCRHLRPVLGVYGGHVRNRSKRQGGRGTADLVGENRPQIAARLLGLPEGCMTMDEYSNAIPPFYSKYIAERVPL